MEEKAAAAADQRATDALAAARESKKQAEERAAAAKTAEVNAGEPALFLVPRLVSGRAGPTGRTRAPA
jgi:hypothetical protein